MVVEIVVVRWSKRVLVEVVETSGARGGHDNGGSGN